MADKEGEQALFHSLLLTPFHHARGDVIQAGAICFLAKNVRYLPHITRLTKDAGSHYR